MLYNCCPRTGARCSFEVLHGCFQVGRKGNVKICTRHVQKYEEHCSREHICSYPVSSRFEFNFQILCLCWKKYSLLSGPGFAWYQLKACTQFQLTCPINRGRNCFVVLFLLPKLNVLSFEEEFDPPVRGTSLTALFYMLGEALLNYASALSSQQREVGAYRDQRSPFPWCLSGL